jgi:hypothetical protein
MLQVKGADGARNSATDGDDAVVFVQSMLDVKKQCNCNFHFTVKDSGLYDIDSILYVLAMIRADVCACCMQCP